MKRSTLRKRSTSKRSTSKRTKRAISRKQHGGEYDSSYVFQLLGRGEVEQTVEYLNQFTWLTGFLYDYNEDQTPTVTLPTLLKVLNQVKYINTFEVYHLICTNEFAQAFRDMIAHNTFLKDFVLYDVHLTSEMLAEIAEGIRQNHTIRRLEITSGEPISSRALAQALAHHTSIIRINITIHSSNWEGWGDLLQQNRVLTNVSLSSHCRWLDMAYTPISEDTIHGIAKGIKINPVIRFIILADVKITEKQLMELYLHVVQNKNKRFSGILVQGVDEHNRELTSEYREELIDAAIEHEEKIQSKLMNRLIQKQVNKSGMPNSFGKLPHEIQRKIANLTPTVKTPYDY